MAGELVDQAEKSTQSPLKDALVYPDEYWTAEAAVPWLEDMVRRNGQIPDLYLMRS